MKIAVKRREITRLKWKNLEDKASKPDLRLRIVRTAIQEAQSSENVNKKVVSPRNTRQVVVFVIKKGDMSLIKEERTAEIIKSEIIFRGIGFCLVEKKAPKKRAEAKQEIKFEAQFIMSACSLKRRSIC